MGGGRVDNQSHAAIWIFAVGASTEHLRSSDSIAY